jgi:hypothetical protein
MQEIFSKYFSNHGKPFCKNLSSVTKAILRCGKANTSLIAKEMSKDNGLEFHSNDIHLGRFLQSSKFQINDSFWRNHIKMIFDFLKEGKIIDSNKPIPINIDFTSSENNFLILFASINVDDKAIMLYFSSRVYYHKGYTINQKKMEEAFIKALRHILSKSYQYIIVADRGFGNKRFINLCKNNSFAYVVRIVANLNIIKEDKQQINLNSLDKQNINNLDCYIKSWQEKGIIDINTTNDSTWILLKSNHQLDAIGIYAKRFKIEKLFQDAKSSGFDIEKSKIKKYDRFKRMLYLVSLAHTIAVILGNFLNHTKNSIKKNSALHTENIAIIISALLDLELEPFPPFIFNPSTSSQESSYAVDNNVG